MCINYFLKSRTIDYHSKKAEGKTEFSAVIGKSTRPNNDLFRSYKLTRNLEYICTNMAAHAVKDGSP